MNVIERELSRLGFKWRLRMFLERMGIAGSVITVLALLLGVGLDQEWITSLTVARIFVAILALMAGIVSVILLVLSLSWMADRQKMANLVEKGQPDLADRLNTLVFLERFRLANYSKYFWYHRRIAVQASRVLDKQPASMPLSWVRTLVTNGLFVVLLGLTVTFYNLRDPWETLHERAVTPPQTRIEKPVDLALPDANALEEKKDWGEIRITDPARDMKITKVDAVPLQIEAASSRPLTSSAWLTSVNGQSEKSHPLPVSKEPKYAVYQPIIYADEFDLRDWDVMTYFAQTKAGGSNSYGSEVYFLEVRPFREDILKMAGGEGGSAYQVLGEITSLISRQQEIIRQTHHSMQSPPATEKLQEQDHGKLADAESDLSLAAQHLYAEIAVKMENKPIGAALDQLGKAGNTLLEAADSLRASAMAAGFEKERAALRQLIDTRKLFQKSVSDHPDDFKDKPDNDADMPIVADSRDKLDEMAEFRNEEKAVADFVNELVRKQTELTADTQKDGNKSQTNNAARQRTLRNELKQFSGQHPQIFNNATNELAQALEAMGKSADSLDKRASSQRKAPGVANEKTQNLATAIGEQIANRQLSGAYRLKKILDQQIEQVKQIEQKPSEPTQENLEKTARQAKETTRQMKQMTEQKPVSNLLGPELGSALGNEQKQSLDQTLDQLARAQSPDDRKELAAKAGENLRQVSSAFEKSQPQALQKAHKQDALKESNGFDRGMEQLRSMMARMQGERPATDEDLKKMAREAQLNIQEDLKNHPDAATQKLLVMLDEAVKEKGRKLDLAGLKKMMAELENISTEVKDAPSQTNDTSVTAMDSSKVPPAYRGRIQAYFRKLSESK